MVWVIRNFYSLQRNLTRFQNSPFSHWFLWSSLLGHHLHPAWREGGKERGEREGRREGGRERGREGGWEGGREGRTSDTSDVEKGVIGPYIY